MREVAVVLEVLKSLQSCGVHTCTDRPSTAVLYFVYTKSVAKGRFSLRNGHPIIHSVYMHLEVPPLFPRALHGLEVDAPRGDGRNKIIDCSILK